MLIIEKLEDNSKFVVGGIYSYAFACNSDSYHTMQVVSVSDTRKTATIRDYYGDDREPEKTYRKKISNNYRGEETISAGNYSMAGSWYSSERSYTKRCRDFDFDFMHRTEAADDLARALADFPTGCGESVYTVSIEFITKDYYSKECPEVSLAAAVNFLDNNAENITAILGKYWHISYTVRKNGKELAGGYTPTNNPAALMECIEAQSEQEYINILLECAAEELPTEVMEAVTAIADEITEEYATLKRAEIEMTTDTDPDDDPTPTDPTPSPDSDTTYSEFDKAFRACNIISVTFGGAQNSAADRELTFSEMPDAAPRKKLTEKTWKMQLAAKAAFEAAEKTARVESIYNQLRTAKIGDAIIELTTPEIVEHITKIDREDCNDEPEYFCIQTDRGNTYEGFDFLCDVAAFATEPEQPDENQLTFDDIAYSTKETSEPLTYSTIDEDAARRGLESYSFSDYKPGSATAAYRVQVDEVLGVAAEVKQQLPEEYHAELDRLTARYSAKLADWTNRKNRADAAYPSCMIAGPANYNMRKHEKQMQRLDKIWSEYSQIQALEEQIRNFAHEIKHRPIKAGDNGALDKLRAKVDELTKLQEKMKQANAEARKNGVDAPYPAWALSNNRQNLKRYADRLAELEKAKSAPTEQAEDGGDGFHIVRNTDIMRLQIIFDDKPDADTRDTLKKNGFKWAPSQGAWQRQLNNNGEYALKSVIKAISK